MTRKLQKSLIQQKKVTEQVVQQIPGLLGIPLGGQRRVEVPNRNAFVFVRLRSNQSEVIQAYNNQVSPAYNLPVLVERHGGRYEVVGVDTARYENNWNSNAAFLPRHGNTHSFDLESGGGGDVVWVYPRQFMPALVLPSGSSGGPNVFVAPYTLQNSNGTWKYVGNTGTANITPYNPTSSTGAIMGLVYLDAISGNPYLLINSGTVFSNSITGSSQVYPYIPTVSSPSTQIPLAAIRLITGSNALSWNNIYDVRQFIHTTTTGSGGGAGGTVIGVMTQDEGVPVGTGTTFNFVGANVQASISGSVVRVFVTGSSGGSVSVQDEGILLGSPSIFNFVGNNVDVSMSGSVARVFVTGSTGGSSFIGDPNSVVLTNGSGSLATYPWLKWGTSSEEFIEFGADVAGKEVNAGKMGYQSFDSNFDIIGAGTGTMNRTVKIYDDLIVADELSTNFMNLNQGTTYNILGVPHGHASFVQVQDEGVPLGTGTIFNFIGSPVDVTRSGTVFNVMVTGTQNITVRDEGQFSISSPSTFNFTGENVSVTASGTTATVAVGGYSLIQDINLTGSASSFDFQSIPATYKHLKLEFSIRSDRAANTSDKFNIKVNNTSTSGSYYSAITSLFHNAQQTSEEFRGTTVPVPVGYATAATAPSGTFAGYEFTFIDYAKTTTRKDWQGRGGGLFATTSGSFQLFDEVGHFAIAGAINRLAFTPNLGTNFVSGSRATLYGM